MSQSVADRCIANVVRKSAHDSGGRETACCSLDIILQHRTRHATTRKYASWCTPHFWYEHWLFKQYLGCPSGYLDYLSMSRQVIWASIDTVQVFRLCIWLTDGPLGYSFLVSWNIYLYLDILSGCPNDLFRFQFVYIAVQKVCLTIYLDHLKFGQFLCLCRLSISLFGRQGSLSSCLYYS